MADQGGVIPEKEEDEQPIVPYGYSQNLIRKKKRCARTLRTILVVANIIFWLGQGVSGHFRTKCLNLPVVTVFRQIHVDFGSRQQFPLSTDFFVY